MNRFLFRLAAVLTVGAIIIFVTRTWAFERAFALTAIVAGVAWIISGVFFQPRTWWRP